jgi:cytochrome bd ubiquinol oxidase subunit I
MEGVWETERGAPLLLFALPDEEARENRFAIGIPKLASLILTHELDGEVRGLNEFPGEHPPVAPVFWGSGSWSAMGLLMLAGELVGAPGSGGAGTSALACCGCWWP